MSVSSKRQPDEQDPIQPEEQGRKDEQGNARSFDAPAPSNFEEDRPPDIVVEN